MIVLERGGSCESVPQGTGSQIHNCSTASLSALCSDTVKYLRSRDSNTSGWGSRTVTWFTVCVAITRCCPSHPVRVTLEMADMLLLDPKGESPVGGGYVHRSSALSITTTRCGGPALHGAPSG